MSRVQDLGVIQEDQGETRESQGLDTGTAPSLEKSLQQREAMLQD